MREVWRGANVHGFRTRLDLECLRGFTSDAAEILRSEQNGEAQDASLPYCPRLSYVGNLVLLALNNQLAAPQ